MDASFGSASARWIDVALQYSVALHDNQNNQIESTLGASPKLQIRSGSPPANCAAADSGTLLCELTLPADFLIASSSGQVTKNGTWSGTASAAGTAGHFRLKDSTGATCHQQGTCGQGSGDMSLDNTNIANGQTVTVNTYSITRGNS